MSDARRYWNLCVFESEVLEWITKLKVSKNGNYSSYLPENVGKFSLGNRMCVLLSDSRTLEEDEEKMDARNVGEGEMSSRILPDNAYVSSKPSRSQPSDSSNNSKRDCTSLYSAQYSSSFAFLFELSHCWRVNGGDCVYISSDMRTWCFYNRALSLKYRRFWLVDHFECECARIYSTEET